MDVSVTLFSTDGSMRPVEAAREAEARGFFALYLPEHTHIPVSRRTPSPMGGDLPEAYCRTLDPFVGLAGAAAVTSRLRLGTGVVLVAQHDPIALAKTVATLDHVSGGRVVLGIGYGWNREEMQDHGVEPKRRRARVREVMLAMQTLWTEEVATFEGEFVRFEPSWAWPKPIQQPRPPILIGGAAGPTLFAHIAEYADGWMPIGGAGLKQHLPRLRQAFEERGRDPDELLVAPTFVAPDPGKLDFYRELGVTECVLPLPPEPRDAVLPILDEYARYL